MALKKPRAICPQCEQVVEFDTVHSGGVILHKCCNCFHIVERAELDQLTKEYHDATVTAN